MAKFKPAAISKGSFAFCRAAVAILVWLAVFWQMKVFLFLVFLIMLLSALLKVEKAPLILLYQFTVDKIKPSPKIIVDERGIFISHLAGAAFALLCLLLTWFFDDPAPWRLTILFAILQTSAAFGFCSALKLYNCINGGTCCRFGKALKGE